MNAMYERTLEIARTKIRGGPQDPVFGRPFLDAAFSRNIFLWDSCMIAGWAKYHIDELPIYQTLDNFYDLQEPDGFICREYDPQGKALWAREHPISTNPPILAWAELQLFSQRSNVERLARVYPYLQKHFDYMLRNLKGEDGLYFCDAFGSGMDNIHRSPRGWTGGDDGIAMSYVDGDVFRDFIEPVNLPYVTWNRQGRMVDISSQMALFARNLAEIARLIGRPEDAPKYEGQHEEIAELLNERCWNQKAGFYFDLGYGEQIPRFHVGMFWALLAGVVPPERVRRMSAHLSNPAKFGRKVAVPGLAADDPEFRPWGDYWRGGVWAPATYMVLLGLEATGHGLLARDLASRHYECVERLFAQTNTFWENYAPDFDSYGSPALPDFCGWTGLSAIAVYREFIVG